MTQTESILNFLKEGNSITPLQALDLFSCFRLSGRIWDLKHRGYSISMKLVESPEGKHYAEYKLAEEDKPPLNFTLEEA